MSSLAAFIQARAHRLPCGELGYLQSSAWEALDTGVTFNTWVAILATMPEVTRAAATLRKQWRLAEKDRNACLVDDGKAHLQTFWGM